MSKKNNQYSHEGIAIIGLGCYFPKSQGIDQFWNNIINKINCITEIPGGRWDPAIYYDPDKSALDKTYSKIGGFVDGVDFLSLTKKYKIPPKVITAMDITQKFALLATGDALQDAGYADKEFDRSRTAVIIGNSMGGDKTDYTDLRVFMWEIENKLKKGLSFSKIDPVTQKLIIEELNNTMKSGLPDITEDTMPGELSNVIAGRISNALNLTGPTFTVDAACASSLASLKEATHGLRYGDFDMAIAGGSDFQMGPGPYVKFCKIGALSPDGSRPFDAGANGFVMGEGAGIFLLKRVSDARRDGDKIYAIITGVGAAADGKGKGITAPNPKGQSIAISRAFEDAGYSPETVQYIEAHGTSTVVGDLAEMEGLLNIWGNNGIKNDSIGIGSIKSNIGHLKSAAGSASIIKLSLALQKKVMPPSLNYKTPNPDIAFGTIPFKVVTELTEWPNGVDGNPRRANASAFGFGGTNFHVTMEEDTGNNGIPEIKKYYAGAEFNQTESLQAMKASQSENIITPVCDYTHKRYELAAENTKKLEGEAIVIGGSSWADINDKITKLKQEISGSRINLRDLAKRYNIESNSMDYRLGVSAFSIDDFIERLNSAPEGFEKLKRRMVLKNKGLFFGENLLAKKNSLSKVCVMFPGQGSQYINMFKDLYNKYKVVKDSFDEADNVLHGIIGSGISDVIFQKDDATNDELEAADKMLMQKAEIMQPGVLAADYAIFRLLRSFGINPDVVIGHSLGEYGALIAAGVMSFSDALYAVSARGREIDNVKWDDVGKMASIPASVEKTEQLLKGIPGYAIIANKNCNSQTVVAGDSPSVIELLKKCDAEGIPAQEIPVSHAFHSDKISPACPSYRKVLEKFSINSPKIDIVANLTGEYYPKGNNVKEKIIDILVKHIANPVEFIKQIERLYADGVNIFIEAGPRRTLSSFVLNILDKRPHLALATNHPKRGGIGTFNDALAAMSTQGFDINWHGIDESDNQMKDPEWRYRNKFLGKQEIIVSASTTAFAAKTIDNKMDFFNMEQKNNTSSQNNKDYSNISIDSLYGNYQSKQRELVKDILNIYSQKSEELLKEQLSEALYYKREVEKHKINFEKVMISGVAMGLPGERFKVFEDNIYDRLAQGINMIDPVSHDVREKIAEKNITRLHKKSNGEASFEIITDTADVVKLSARKGKFNFEEEYGFDKEFTDKLEIPTQLAIAAGIEALKDAGIPLVMNYKLTSTNKMLPTYWALPENMQDDTGIIFAAAFPGENSLIEELSKALAYKYGTKSKKELVKLYTSLIEKVKDDKIREELSEWYAENYTLLKDGIGEDKIYQFNRKFIFRILVMGHSQFAELIKAKGPNIHINTACSSTTTATGIAEDWIRTGRAKRVLIIAADDVTSNTFIEWILSGFLAVGAVTIQEKIENAALPFDKRRNGFIVGMASICIVVEAESEVRKRGMEPIVEIISTEFSNSAFHGTKIDNVHVAQVMEKVVAKAEARLNLKREEIVKQLLFMSHETYTPARGGSASSEINALRTTFKEGYKDILISNTKGFTGHTMAVGVEDVVAVRALQTGKVPPIANLKELDPELGTIKLSNGGTHDYIKYALRLGAGFGSQIAMSMLKLVSKNENRIVDEGVYTDWLKKMSGIENPELEIVNRTLRVKDDGSILKKGREAVIETVPAQAISEESFIETQKTGFDASQPILDDEIIRNKIMKIVGEKTGYPEDLIEFDLDMESDLGIDTVKQAEMFGMIREMFKIPVEVAIAIKDFPTLNHVIEFVKQKSPMKFDAPAATVSPVASKPAALVSIAQNSAPSGGFDEIKQKIMKIVEEKTGYPQDLIEFDLDMESDLGIDTVKQAEMFGMIREMFNIPAEVAIAIKDFPTLNHVIEFVKQKSPMKFDAPAVLVSPAPFKPAVQVSATQVSASSGGFDEIKQKIMKIVEEKTGYPQDLIEFDLDMESDLGIDTVKQAEMFGMIREMFKIPAEVTIAIKDFPTLNHVIEFVKQKSTLKFSDSPSTAISPSESKPVAQMSATQPSASSGELDDIRKKIIKIVEEKTGYPEDLIEFDLDMESDLGIDTVKQAEMFGMIREMFKIPAEVAIAIKDFPTLNHVIEFVRQKSSMKFNDAPGIPVSQAVSKPSAVLSAASILVSSGELDEIKKILTKIVEEKTGYPQDLIEFDLDMESDLGIDTVKQAEMFGMIREMFKIPAEESIKIKDFPTLNHVIEFVRQKSPEFGNTGPKESKDAEKSAVKTEANKVTKSNIKRMTLEMREVALDKKAAQRFNFNGINVLITDDGKGIAKALEKSFKEAQANVQILNQTEMNDIDALKKALERIKQTGKINGIIHLTSIEDSKPLDEMNFEDWRKNVFKRIKSLFFISKSLQQDILENAKNKNAFIVSATDMGGTFGIEDFSSNNPIGGGVIGLTKALNKEFNQNNKGVLVKSIDLDNTEKPAVIAKTILNEIQLGGEIVEVGYTGKTRKITQVIYKDIEMDVKPLKDFPEGSVFLVTGGGYGITSAIAKDIAKNLKAKLAIISLETLPSNIKELASLDDNGLKQLKEKLVSELKSQHERVTPVIIDKEYGKYTIAIEIYKNLEEMRKLGAPDVEYYSCNVMDNMAMTDTINNIRERFGTIDAIIHGAGIEQSKLMEDKTFEDFSRVLDVKADGCYNLMESTKNDNVKALVTFASISGRFGNIGQTDYSAANDLLNKYVQHSNKRFAPNMKAVSMNWSGWKGVGMATRGSITKIFEDAGIDMIPMEEGVTKVREELLYGNDSEILVAGNIAYIDVDKIIAGEKTNEFIALLSRIKSKEKYPMIDDIESYKPGRKIVVRKKLDTEIDIYLKDHSIEDVPYLPAVMGIEIFAEAASLLFPKYRIKLMKDIKFNIPVKILKGKPIDLIVTVEKIDLQGNEVSVKTKLETEFFNKDGIKLGDNKLHFEAEIILSDKGADKKKLKADENSAEIFQLYKQNGERIIDEKEIYKRYFHGPSFQVLSGIINLKDNAIYGAISGKNANDGNHFSFVKKPEFITNPMAIEATFQNAGMYAMKTKNKLSLPDTIEELIFVQIPHDAKDLYVSAKHIASDDMKHEYNTVILDSHGNVFSVMKGYKMINIGDLKDNEKF